MNIQITFSIHYNRFNSYFAFTQTQLLRSFTLTCTRILGLWGDGKGTLCMKWEMCLEEKKMIWFSRNKLKPFYLKTKITNNIKMVHACSEDQKQRASKSHRANVTFRTYLSSSDNQNGRLDHDSDWKLV